jgi:hypothetical protein
MVNHQDREATDVKLFEFRIMLIYFFDIGGIIHCEFVPETTTINQTFYMEVLESPIVA